MTSKEAHKILFSGPVGYTLNEYNEASNVIYKSLKRLEVLDKLVTDDCIAGNEVGLQIVNNLIERSNTYRDKLKIATNHNDYLEQENEKLKKALDEACKMLSWDCPCGQDLIDDLDCENRCQPDIDYSECWMKYFLKEVLSDEMV